MDYRVRVEQQVKDFLATLAPEHRRSAKQGFGRLAREQGDIKALDAELEGFCRLRVGPYRIIFRYRPGRVIECVYMNRRAIVYEIFEREVVDKLREQG
jgi:mRNA-degrading endonuclease RelE of RelBE toxin-antitoxin system